MSPQHLTKEKFRLLLARFVQNKCSPEEETYVLEWYKRIGHGDDLQLTAHEREIVEKRMWAQLSGTLPASGRRTPAAATSHWPLIRVAAVLLLVFSVLGYAFVRYYLRNADTGGHQTTQVTEESSFMNREGTPHKLAMSDGSFITLQPGARIRYGEMTGNGSRVVWLEGDAFFEVVRNPNRPFIVYAGEIMTRVLGTSFIIEDRKHEGAIDVVVKTGKVAVAAIRKSDQSASEVVITPNQKATFKKSDRSLIAGIVSNPLPLSVQQNQMLMNFEEASVVAILKAIEKAYGITIQFDEEVMKTCSLTTRLTNEGLYERLNIICKAIGGAYETKGKEIFVISNGCNQTSF